MIPTEDNYVEWFTCSVRYYFLKEGFGFLSFALGQLAEPGFPAEAIASEGNVLAGLTFARPAEAGPQAGPREYEMTAARRESVSAAGGWVFYALPQFAEALDQQLTHQKVLFARPSAAEPAGDGRVRVHDAIDFKQLVAGLGNGTLGRRLPSGFSAADLLAETRSVPLSICLVVNPRAKLVFSLKATSGTD